MNKIQNISSLGALHVPLLGRDVDAGEIVDVTDEQWALLGLQHDNYQLVPWSEWLVDDLRDEAARRGVETTGNKTHLIQRIGEHELTLHPVPDPEQQLEDVDGTIESLGETE